MSEIEMSEIEMRPIMNTVSENNPIVYDSDTVSVY